jgi:hypothetical protein
MTDHMVRANQLFDGDLTAAIVLATVAHHNLQRYYDEVARRAPAGLDALVDAREHVPHLRPCNALSVASATGIPRETVRRKVRWLVGRGMLTVGERQQLLVAPGLSGKFADFDAATLERFEECARAVIRVIDEPRAR